MNRGFVPSSLGAYSTSYLKDGKFFLSCDKNLHKIIFKRILTLKNIFRNQLVEPVAFSGIKIAPIMPRKNIGIVDKAKPRVIVGRLPTIVGGGPTVPDMEQRGKPRVL